MFFFLTKSTCDISENGRLMHKKLLKERGFLTFYAILCKVSFFLIKIGVTLMMNIGQNLIYGVDWTFKN